MRDVNHDAKTKIVRCHQLSRPGRESVVNRSITLHLRDARFGTSFVESLCLGAPIDDFSRLRFAHERLEGVIRNNKRTNVQSKTTVHNRLG